jgi:hypothetical protein
MFDKTLEANWAVAWHQDRTLPVAERFEIEGFGPWSTKDGLLHVAPPFEILARMITLRVHLDPVDAANAPLRAALGSHRLGRVAAKHAAARAAEHPVIELPGPGRRRLGLRHAHPARLRPRRPAAPAAGAAGGLRRFRPAGRIGLVRAILRRPDLSATARAC